MLAYGYCRYSSDMQNEKSIEQQKNELDEYAQKNNIQIVKYYIDEAKSGRSDTRDSFQEMIHDCRKKDVQCILVWKTDRFARKTLDNLFYRNQLEKLGIKLISITQPMDMESPEGKLMSTLLAGMDEYFSQNLASNVKRALKNNANNLQFNGGIAPLGYDIVDKKYVINERESFIVKQIFDMYINGLSYVQIALNLNLKGYVTKKGKPFAKTSVLSILENEKYTGKYIYNKGTKSNHRGYRDDVIIVENAIPKIIDDDIFNKVKNRKRNKPHAENKAKRTYLLSGLIHCSCGGTYTGFTSIKIKNGKEFKYGYYRCNNRNKLGGCTMPLLIQDKLEKYILDLLKKEFTDNTTIEKIVKEVNRQYKLLTNDSDEIEMQVEENQKKINNLMKLVYLGNTTRVVSEKIADLEKMNDILKQEIVTRTCVNEDLIRKVLMQDISQLENKENYKQFIQKWIKKIEVTNDFIDIYFNSSQLGSNKMVARIHYLLYQRINLIDFIPMKKEQ